MTHLKLALLTQLHRVLTCTLRTHGEPQSTLHSATDPDLPRLSHQGAVAARVQRQSSSFMEGLSRRWRRGPAPLSTMTALSRCNRLHLLQIGKGQWGRVLDMVTKIRKLDMEVCTTLGMLTPEQARELRTAGLTAYNHNLDTSPEYYPEVTSTRKYSDRLDTIGNVRDAGISVCAGGIIGLGEGEKDRVGLLLQLATLPAHPESVPINRLVAVKGTPFEDKKVPSGLDLVRCIATARLVMPATVVRLSAGRLELSAADQVLALVYCEVKRRHRSSHTRSDAALLQAMAFLAGANSIFSGDKLLTTPNPDKDDDAQLFDTLGLRGRPAFVPYAAGEASSCQGSV